MNARANVQKQRAMAYQLLRQHLGTELTEAYASVIVSPIPDQLLKCIDRLMVEDDQSGTSETAPEDSSKSPLQHKRFSGRQRR